MKNPHHPTLLFLGEPFDGRTYEFETEKITVGRSSQSSLCIQDASVSAKHCEILVNGPEIIIRDLNSSNGTFVNGARVTGQTQVKHGQIVRIGNINARLELAGQEVDETASCITAVHLHAKHVRDVQEELNAPKPSSAQVTLEAGASGPPDEHTVTMPAVVASRPVPPSEVGVSPQQHGDQRSVSGGRKLGLVVVVVVMIPIAVAIMWWLLRK